jgi:ABC-type multidrug transport system ATPase subunit
VAARISVEDVAKTYVRVLGQPVQALAGVSLEVEPGEVFGLIGPNGAGKTTLLSCLLGLIRPDRGRLSIDGRPPDDLAVRKRAGYLPERLGFGRDLSGREFLTMHARLSGMDRRAADAAAELAAARTDLAAGALERPLRTYSRGMLQRVGLAQALVASPDLLFLDEPASGMDPAGVALVRQRILEAKAAGATVLLNSHQLPEVERVCDRVAFLDHGRIERLEVLRDASGGRAVWAVRVGTGQEAAAEAALAAAGFLVSTPSAGMLRVEGVEADLDRIAPTIVAANLALRELKVADANLEALFLSGGARG